MDKSYQPNEIEKRIYARWEEAGYFAPRGDGEPYCIMIPPPNVTGTLHMGHAFQDTIMDALTRYKRMQGCKALWQPGMDHAGIATQMVVERLLSSEGTSRRELGREKFVERVWQWKEQSGGQIANQLRRLGGSVDWSRDRFTMDEGLSRAVSEVFVTLYDEGLIYRGKRLVNWDPVLHTALSDLEVLSADEDGQLWHFRYPLASGEGHLVVATTRPETMLGDSAVAVHPDDDRYRDLVGQEIILPIVGRRIPIIADDYVDPEFGTGCVKITPAHDFNDYDIGKRHELPMYNVLTDDAAMNDEVPEAYRGMDRFEARKAIVAEFESLRLLEKIESYTVKIPRGDRSHAVVEPYLTDQWYVSIKPLAEPAIAAVENGDIRFVPENWSKTYFEWMYNIQDWCISRQLWWGHRIPAWYDDDGNVYVGNSEDAVREKHGIGNDVTLRQDEDVLDTWFSSALWPFSTLGWPDKNEALDDFYPGSVLVTGFDIIFFWVARMIMMGIKFMGDVPFREVYIHGLIRDQDGQKMSKSKGNVLDPLDLIDGVDLDTLLRKRTTGLMQEHLKPQIEKATRKQFPDGIDRYGADALRFTFASLATTGRDIRFDLGRIEGYKNFCNKLWNAARYVLMNTGELDAGEVELSSADRWIRARFDETVASVHRNFDGYRLDLVAQTIYEFTWHEFCDWYLELSKPVLQSETSSEAAQRGTRRTLVEILEGLLRLLHPIMPFVTEEIWQQVAPRAGIEAPTIMLQPYPQPAAGETDDKAVADIEWLKKFILGVRQIRGEMDIPPGKPLPVILENASEADVRRANEHGSLLHRVGRVESVTLLGEGEEPPAAATALLDELRLLVPMKGMIDVDAERKRLGKQLEKVQTDLDRARSKLDNPNFVNNAPADVVTQEKQRAADFERQIAQFSEQLEKLDDLG
ncbi:MAG: valine--tRNA ligase [Gammaproteobacteria bacterium]|jgi:valyl-tRNA synthetase|nr:valine--tRNA ligase [Gammaproteobacteria bacterium]MDH3864292.1 valine--tRNA ligase [Gammaproteobacteria bacterium]MDH3905096.1 valine--tRNA ligase [Gammaproteobacteria bacterium]MDH3953312.1 valine--tRNA ligase [Gammaproteobacteria bacterium]MDH4006018.1 valine--tRNA ligase [Gammaproteobacteria bacterium]